MLKIAALDDEPMYLEQIRKVTEKHFKEKKILYEFRKYDKYEALLFAVEDDGDFDLFLLDVDLKGHSGLEVAEKIRQYDDECAIVCVTNFVEYAPAAYEVNAFRYILKKELAEKLPKMYDDLCLRLSQKEEQFYMVKTDSRMERLYYKNIMYVQKEKKYVVFHMKDGLEVRDRKTLDEIERKLTDKDFARIDKGCIVNLNHVVSIKRQDCKMRDGMVLAVSQARSRGLKEKMAAFWDVE